MHTDELRRELGALADEVDAFDRDLDTLHRRRRYRRAVSIAVAVVVLGAGSATAIALGGRKDAARVNVDTSPTKEVAASQMTRVNAVVFPATPQVRHVLDRSAVVADYALAPRRALPTGAETNGNLLETEPAINAICGLRTVDGYAVEAVSPLGAVASSLQATLGQAATVIDLSDSSLAVDVELFMHVGAPEQQTAAVRARLQSDPAVRSFEFVDKSTAYGIFKKDFADQPALIAGTRPADLPESFRVVLEARENVAAFAARYQQVSGVDTAITAGKEFLHALLLPSSVPSDWPLVCPPG